MKNQNAIFRPFRPGDEESLSRHADNINIWNNTRDALPHPYTVEDGREFIKYATGTAVTTDFAIEVDGAAVGSIGYKPGSDVQKISAEVGYWLGEEFWNRGIASQVLASFCDHIFAATGISHLYANVFAGNVASMRVLEKAGFRPAGIMHRAAVKNGQMIDLYYYEKLKD